MKPLRSRSQASKSLHREIRECLRRVRRLASKYPAGLKEGIDRLRELRKAVFEDINQIQHEALILAAARWLQNKHHFGPKAVWEWNPRAGGTRREPDLRVRIGEKVRLSAEATASEGAKGILDSRMRDTLRKLAKMKGKRYYFVKTEVMARRARSKVGKTRNRIQVVRL